MQRSTDTQKEYAITTSFELGKFFPDKAKVSAVAKPIYYSVTKEEVRPRYNPLDSDMRLKRMPSMLRPTSMSVIV